MASSFASKMTTEFAKMKMPTMAWTPAKRVSLEKKQTPDVSLDVFTPPTTSPSINGFSIVDSEDERSDVEGLRDGLRDSDAEDWPPASSSEGAGDFAEKVKSPTTRRRHSSSSLKHHHHHRRPSKQDDDDENSDSPETTTNGKNGHTSASATSAAQKAAALEKSALKEAARLEDEAERAADERERRYKSEVDEMRLHIDSQRLMWAQLVRESEAEAKQLRDRIQAVASDRDKLRRRLVKERYRLEDDEGELVTLTRDLVARKMDAAELQGEIDMLRLHDNLLKTRYGRES